MFHPPSRNQKGAMEGGLHNSALFEERAPKFIRHPPRPINIHQIPWFNNMKIPGAESGPEAQVDLFRFLPLLFTSSSSPTDHPSGQIPDLDILPSSSLYRPRSQGYHCRKGTVQTALSLWSAPTSPGLIGFLRTTSTAHPVAVTATSRDLFPSQLPPSSVNWRPKRPIPDNHQVGGHHSLQVLLHPPSSRPANLGLGRRQPASLT